MSHPLYVAFIWHQHQPLYKSRSAIGTKEGNYRLPWVRLHGTKDYLDLALILAKYPKLHQTFNLVPSLILQLEDYIADRALDPYLSLALTRVEDLSIKQKQFIIEHFFDCHYHTMIEPHHRYAELYHQKQDHGLKGCIENWKIQDYADLLAWHNLAWFDPLFWDDPQIAGWLKQGTGFRLKERQEIFAKQKEILAKIIPQHKQMQDAGQIEVTTTPYTHPILPLLADTDCGRVAVPDMKLPEKRFQWAEDLPRHLKKSWDLYIDRFGRSPKGLWPSEQAVGPSILPDIIKQGFQWICSDEAVLGWTIGEYFSRDGAGNPYKPEALYQPYRLETSVGDLSIVFRDHRLSDLIGFSYGGMDAKKAASDLVGHLESIARTLKHRQSSNTTSLEKPWLVTIALDGENCWEYYPQDGKAFLESLYHLLSDQHDLKLVTVSEFLEKYPPTATIKGDKLHTGSWVDGSLTTWIGDPAKNRAWELLADAREVLAKHPQATEAANPEAWEALYAAEGSDWCWWFGEGHSSNQSAMFDQLYREHLAAIYQALGEPVPEKVKEPIEQRDDKGDRAPQGFIHPLIDGRGDEQDWDKAGRIEIAGAMGTMHRSSIVQRLWYGLDHLNFYLRLDFVTGIKIGIDCPPELNLFWYYPDQHLANSGIPLNNVPHDPPNNYYFHHHLEINLLTQSVRFQEAIENNQWVSRFSRAHVGRNKCLEIAVPWADLQVAVPDWQLRILLVFSEDNKFRSYLPENQLIHLSVP